VALDDPLDDPRPVEAAALDLTDRKITHLRRAGGTVILTV
jgi:hypothetical protein